MVFKERVWDAIKEMKKKKYTPTEFIKMIIDEDEIKAVKLLINNPKPSYGFTRLYELKALNLSMEAIILEEEWHTLFSEEERIKARKKLNDYGYKI
jgi:hypothetical protein